MQKVWVLRLIFAAMLLNILSFLVTHFSRRPYPDLFLHKKASLRTKLLEVMEFQLSYFKSWKMMLWKCCTRYASKCGKLSSSHRTGKGSVFIPIPKKGNPKECSNYRTVTLVSHTSKVMLKILQARLQQYVNYELPDFKLVLEKAEEPEIKLPTSAESSKQHESSRKTSISALLTMPKPLCGSQ